LECSWTDGAAGVSDWLVVVSLELEVEGRTTTTGGLTTVFFVTVLLVMLDAAGTLDTVLLSDSIEVWANALPARPTVTPIAAAEIHKLNDFISSNLLIFKAVNGSRQYSSWRPSSARQRATVTVQPSLKVSSRSSSIPTP
jgi:hypothetical protein